MDGQLRWLHSASTSEYSLITVHDKRGTAAMDAAGVLPGWTGVAVRDAWAPYGTYSAATHALCAAHVRGELQALTDLSASATGEWCWATQAADALPDLQKLIDTARATAAGPASATTTQSPASTAILIAVDLAAVSEAISRNRCAAQIGFSVPKDRADKVQAKHHGLARRLITREADYLRFTTNPQIPPDNDSAEREIQMINSPAESVRLPTSINRDRPIHRPPKLRQSYVATAQKHEIRFFRALTTLAEGRPWMPQPS